MPVARMSHRIAIPPSLAGLITVGAPIGIAKRKKPAAIGAKAPFPGFIEPALATSIEKTPSGSRWIHEIKFDGYRVQLHIANEGVSVFTRNGHDWTKRFKKIAHNAFLISASSAIIDGEVVVPSVDGTTDFSVLQNQLKGKSDKIVLVAFDLLYLNGYDLRKLPLVERKTLLKKLIAKTAIQFSESFEADGPEMFKHACGVGLEGVVSKVRDSRYNSGRGNDWVKKTRAQRETLPIAGFALKDNRFDGLYIGRINGDQLVYAGKIEHGFDKLSAKDLQARLKPLIRKTQPYTKKIAHQGIWVEPSFQRSNTGPNPPRARYATPSSKACGRICKIMSPRWRLEIHDEETKGGSILSFLRV
jgi:bifunctional non-homologous end joining protein LigD